MQPPGSTLLLPPFVPHMTISLGGSFLCGYDFEAIEFYPSMLSGLDVEMSYAKSKEAKEFLDMLVGGLEIALDKGSSETKQQIIQSWIANSSAIAKWLKAHHVERICDTWKRFLQKTSVDRCPSCTRSSSPFSQHMMSHHVDILRPHTFSRKYSTRQSKRQ